MEVNNERHRIMYAWLREGLSVKAKVEEINKGRLWCVGYETEAAEHRQGRKYLDLIRREKMPERGSKSAWWEVEESRE